MGDELYKNPEQGCSNYYKLCVLCALCASVVKKKFKPRKTLNNAKEYNVKKKASQDF